MAVGGGGSRAEAVRRGHKLTVWSGPHSSDAKGRLGKSGINFSENG